MPPSRAPDEDGRRTRPPASGRPGPTLGRRAFGALVAGTAGMAGCTGHRSSVDEGSLDGRVVSVHARGLPGQTELNPYRARTVGFDLFQQFQHLVFPADVATGDYLTSGHAWSVDGEELTVPTVVADYEVDAPDGVRLTFDDRLTYWNGEPLDARAYALDDAIRWLAGYGAFRDETRGDELRSDTEYWRAFFEPRPANRHAAADRIHPGMPPLPPSFTEPWAERYRDASTERAVDEVYVDLTSVSIGFEEVIEEGYGTGVYAPRSVEDLGTERVLAARREDHPGDAAVEYLVVEGVGAEGEGPLIESGAVDLAPGIAADIGGTVDSDSLPDGVDQLAVFPDPTRPGYQLSFNWESVHLRRLWVRRALVAAVPFDDIVDTAWGEGQRPPVAHAGMLPFVDERTLGSAFALTLHQYPIARARDTATEWLEAAGYALASDSWFDADGDLLDLTLLVPPGSSAMVTASEMIADELRAFGAPVDLVAPGAERYRERIEDGEWDLTIGRTPSGWTPVDYYADATDAASDPSTDQPEPPEGVGVVREGRLVAPPTAIPGNPLEGCTDASAPASTPGRVSLPLEAGALRIEGADYADGGATYDHPTGVGRDHSVCEAAATLTDDVDDGTIRTAARICARWYNYAVPNFVFSRPAGGVLGNVDEFAFPGESHRAHRGRDLAIDQPGHYHVQAGLVR